MFGEVFLFVLSLKPYLLISMSTNRVSSGAASHSLILLGEELWSEEI